MRYEIKQRLVTGEDVAIAAFETYGDATKYASDNANEYKGITFAVYDEGIIRTDKFVAVEDPPAPEGHGAFRINKALTDLFTDAFVPQDYLHINVTEFNPPILFDTPDEDMRNVLVRIAIDVLKDCVHDIEEHDNDAAATWLTDQNLSIETAKDIIKKDLLK